MTDLTANKPAKPLGRKAYGSIAHLPGSRMGPADHHCHEGQARIATEKARDSHDRVYVEEKLDGSCVSVARIGDGVVSLGRAGYPAWSSPFEQHHLFADWAEANAARFLDVLEPGERIVGEWLAQAHGTRYDLPHEPFVAFDIIRETTRIPRAEFWSRLDSPGFSPRFVSPRLIDDAPLSIKDALHAIEHSGHGALDPVEGCVWRVERDGKVDFLVKYVRPDKVDGALLPELTGADPVWNWRP